MAWPANVGLHGGRRERVAFGDAELQFDQVEPGDQLGDRMLDLEAGVHLEERRTVPVRSSSRNSTVPAPT